MLNTRLNTELNLDNYVTDQHGKLDMAANKKVIYEQIRQKRLHDIKIKHIILDCSCMNYVDPQGIHTILQVL